MENNNEIFSFNSLTISDDSMNSSSSNESSDYDTDKIINEDIDSKEINGGKGYIIFNAKVKDALINQGNYNILVNNLIDNLELFGGKNDVHIKSQIVNLIISGGKTNIYIYDLKEVNINKINIKGGEHRLYISSFVHKLDILGGNIIVNCNYLNSEIDKIISLGGTRDFYLNNNTNKCFKNVKGGTFNFHITAMNKNTLKLPNDLKAKIISSSNVLKDKENEICTICLNNYKVNKKIFNLPCNHFFHIACLQKWFKGKKTNFCPNCKFKFKGILIE